MSKETQTKNCFKCGNEFERTSRYGDDQWINRKYCSLSCSASKVKISHNLIAEAYNKGQSSTKISEQAGVSPAQVRRILHKTGVKIRSDSEGEEVGAILTRSYSQASCCGNR